jgi:hypothetical protein
MIVLKATKTQYNSLNGFQNGISKLEFAKDINDNWVVGLEVLEDKNFAEIKEQLSKLTQIEFIEPILKNE